MSETPQIMRGSLLGDLIYEYASKPDVLNMVDVGMGGGLGTTKILYDAIINNNKKNYLVYAIEMHKPFYDAAVRNLPKLVNFNLLHGYLTREMTKIEDFEDRYIRGYTREQARGWYYRDLEEMNTVENVFDRMPDRIDLLILDSGPFSSYHEFKLLEDRCRYIALDDTYDIKNIFVLNEMLSHPEIYNVIKENQNDRNGWAFVERKI